MAIVNKDKRSASEVAFHQAEIARLTLKDKKTQAEIATILSISQATVSRDLKALRKSLARQSLAVAESLFFELEEIKGEALTAWKKSKKPRETVTIRDGEKGYTETKTETGAGNPAYLAEIRQTIQVQAKLLGLDIEPAIRLKLGDEDGKTPNVTINVTVVPDGLRPVDDGDE